jgi:sulfur-oxidizing protein SoxA
MRGVAARYPSFATESNRPVDLQGRINLCRRGKQNATPYPLEGPELLAITAYVANQSRGMPIAPDADPRLDRFRARGEKLYQERQGQLNLSCAQCHDDHGGRSLGGSLIPQGHPTGYPLYRLEWQGLGSLQRRMRNCMAGVRADPYPNGADAYVDLELFLMTRARGMPVETPAVRP